MAINKLMRWLRHLGHGSLRTHLFALVLVSIVPVVIFALLVLGLFARQEKASLATGLRETARALSSAMDREFDATRTALEAVATMETLETGDLAQYYRTLRRILQSRTNWQTIVLHDAAGRQILNLRNPFGEPLSDLKAEPESLGAVLQKKSPAPIHFYQQTVGAPIVGLRVPVVRAGELKYVLSAEMDPAVFGTVLARQKLPAQTSAIIADGRNVIVASSKGQEVIGQSAGPLIGEALPGQMDGWFEGPNRDGVSSYAAFSRSPGTGWSVLLTVPATLLEGPLKRSFWALGGAGAIFLVAAFLGVMIIESRITEPLSELARKTESLGRGEPILGSLQSPITEVEALGSDIQRAAALLAARGRERDHAEHALRNLNDRLELRIAERTEQLENKNSELRHEISERHAAEEALRSEHIYLNLLRSTELATHESPNIKAVFDAALEQICLHFGAPLGYCIVDHEQRFSLWYANSETPALGALRSALAEPTDNGPAAAVLASGNIDCIKDLTRQREPWAGKALEAGLTAVCAMPVTAAGKVAGALAFFSPQAIHLDARLAAVLEQLTLQLGRVIERKNAEELLRLSEEQFRMAFDAGPTAICMVAGDRRIVRVNRAFCELVGSRREELLGQSFTQFVCPQERDRSEERIARLFRGEQDRYAVETCLVGELGEVLTCCITAASIASQEGAPRYVLKLIEDITQRKRMEEQLRESERLAAVGATSAMFAHEIGNPLNGISTTVQMIERDLARSADWRNPTILSALADIKNEVTRLGALLHEFRYLARPQRLDLQPVYLATLVGDVMAADGYAARAVHVEIDIPTSLPPLRVDKEKFKQALANLVENAFDAMPSGGTLTVRADLRDDKIVLDVSDTGIGIDPKINVFEFFTTTKPNGTGLGLAVVRQIVSAHGGWVEYHSEPGQGTVFSVVLPTDNELKIGN